MNYILWIGAIVFCIDQITKLFAISYLPLHRPLSLVDGFFNLTLIFNTGAAFGVLTGRGFLLIVISIITIVSLVAFAALYSKEKKIFYFSLALILGGAAGNLFDRIVRGYVIDFLDFFFREYHWPAFNVADSCICIGTFFLIIYFIKSNSVRR